MSLAKRLRRASTWAPLSTTHTFSPPSAAPAPADAHRAVTPPHRPLRFNARFFMIDARHVEGSLAGSGELLRQRWFPIEEARGLELAGITQRVLLLIEDLLADPLPKRPDEPVPYFKHMGDYHLRIDE